MYVPLFSVQQRLVLLNGWRYIIFQDNFLEGSVVVCRWCMCEVDNWLKFVTFSGSRSREG